MIRIKNYSAYWKIGKVEFDRMHNEENAEIGDMSILQAKNRQTVFFDFGSEWKELCFDKYQRKTARLNKSTKSRLEELHNAYICIGFGSFDKWHEAKR